MNFKEALDHGQAGESHIANYLKSKGCTVIPCYEKIMDTGKGPQIFRPNGSLVAPDLWCFSHKNKDFFFAEVKTKTGFSFHRLTRRMTTGIDIRHYNHYIEVLKEFEKEVFMFFLQMGGKVKDTHVIQPSGLYMGRLSELMHKENHRSEKWGRSGMVYWSEKDLTKLAEISDVVTISNAA